MIAVQEIGWRARAALEASGGQAGIYARMNGSTWLEARGEILWLGRAGAPLHARAILTASDPARSLPASDPVASDITTWLDASRAREWRPAPTAIEPGLTSALIDGARRLHADLGAIGAPEGLARLLLARGIGSLDMPRLTPERSGLSGGAVAHLDTVVLERAAPHVRALAAACETDSPTDAVAAALPLLGLGSGLTPAGDDLAGGAFFARRLLAEAGAADPPGWHAARERVRRAARELTHPISAALLGDLLDGEGHAPLHELLAALLGDADAMAPARRLVGIGHSSGWDVLGGFLIGLRAGR